jgi:hypothetical protein
MTLCLLVATVELLMENADLKEPRAMDKLAADIERVRRLLQRCRSPAEVSGCVSMAM